MRKYDFESMGGIWEKEAREITEKGVLIAHSGNWDLWEYNGTAGRRGESEKTEKCKICGSHAQIVKTNLGYFCECSKNGHIHNAGIYPNAHICKSSEEAEKEWNEFNK